MEGMLKSLMQSAYQNWVMIIIGLGLMYLAVKKDFEPALLIPIGFGCIMANLPLSGAIGEHGALTIIKKALIDTELAPLLIFIGVGAMIDFGPLLQNPKMILFGAAAQFGIFSTLLVATLLGYTLKEAASIGIIGAADGPTSILVANRFAKHLLAPISVAAYSYMSLVPIIQPPVIKAITTKEERKIKMTYRTENVSKFVRLAFPVIVTIISGVIAPESVALIGFLMFGNFMRETGVVERLSKSAQNELVNITTILLGLTIGATMEGGEFLQPRTIFIIGLGLIAFILDTAGGVLFAKLLNLFLKDKINPMVGAAGISAFPMSSRVIQRLAQKEDPSNFLLMYAVGANVAGQIGSVIAGGLILSLIK
ncbi:glutaconyl-CoA decarboxylase subunit beta [Oxobacter pfennigii]|uniref:Glutaconyl-CoA decarboxylase subunit beta n=1 Tax=Oxobacter pfennigii TaxID=36849 RepID=A0A0P8WC34_9CLOT|nr:sodium ion-translocating decarboxylase subunit beta [Oxobacter pfennigii]KPU45284.1 glutaconyl-CoA decarboxylase subunit beta [Oxobacter pfennigii]